MLSLIGIKKDYRTGGQTVHALNDVTIHFRKNEFVSVLGPSGCGKTTLLNLIGGLDRYNAGDIVIRGRSTKDFRDRDWDAYRNHTIGFVFQSYNLIPHQTVLANVELALTLTGVTRAERRRRAEKVLARVGLGDQMHKKPGQMSGGQMQRVAIARALINDPDILLADEPTGALDSETSVQVMELLKEIASDRLVVMVTHNPELAEAYSTRIVRLLDGRVVNDSDPFDGNGEQREKEVSGKKPSMSYWTALSLSLNNLLTKKTRTILIAVAGSIGIIGIALILSLSTGVQAYIDRVEQETLSSYPITITSESVDTGSMLETMMGNAKTERSQREENRIYSGEMMAEFLTAMLSEVRENDLASFKAAIDADEGFKSYVSGITYQYNINPNIWSLAAEGEPLQVNPSTTLENMTGMAFSSDISSYMNSMSSMSSAFGGRSMNVWQELMDNQALLDQQYDVVAGRWPESFNEVVLVVNADNSVSDFTLYTLGLKPQEELVKMFGNLMRGQPFELDHQSYSYDEILSLAFKLVLPTDYYTQNANGTWNDIRGDADALREMLSGGVDLRVVGIVRPSEDSVVSPMNGGSIGYLSSLTEYVVNGVNASEIVKCQREAPEYDVFTGNPFAGTEAAETPQPIMDMSTIPEAQLAYFNALPDEEKEKLMAIYAPKPTTSASTYEDNLMILGVADLKEPSNIIIYPRDFEAKEAIERYIDAYNARMEEGGRTDSVIRYTDYIGILLSGVTSIIDAITYVLVAFVAISLIVSSIMIGVITYISVLERTKEIGILRAIGASKRDISHVFNAETAIIGFLAGAFGILISWLLVFPINAIIESLAGIADMAILPGAGAAALVAISIILTLIAGLIPSRFAAKRDPVEALRSE